MGAFNHRLISLARDARALTQSQLAKKTRLSQSVVSKYEAGLLLPTEDAVNQISDALRYPASFFFQNEQAYGFPPFHFRKRKKLGAKALNRIVAEMNIRRVHVKKLSISYDADGLGVIPELDPDEYSTTSNKRPTTEDLARHMRELWMVPDGPIDNMVDLLERNGGIVIPCDFGTDQLDAMSQRIDGMPVLFYVNVNAPADRVRHTLAHELGHMVLHTLVLREDQDMEDEANAFAGAFLVPAKEFKAQMRQFSLRHLANLKGYWKVSMAALAMRADRLSLISPYQKKIFFIEMGKLGIRKLEPGEPPAEHPEALNRMIRFHQQVLSYSQNEMAKLLDLLPDEFDSLYGSAADRNRPVLRLVK
jgi:Zn-dependent peptidase ImmA (M78 family)/transcriptional regulator with XRE-family HTH domain